MKKTNSKELEAEITRLRFMATAANERADKAWKSALDQAEAECSLEEIDAKANNCKQEALGASWCRKAIQNLRNNPKPRVQKLTFCAEITSYVEVTLDVPEGATYSELRAIQGALEISEYTEVNKHWEDMGWKKTP